MPMQQFKQEVEKELTGRETEPWEIVYLKLYQSQIPVRDGSDVGKRPISRVSSGCTWKLNRWAAQMFIDKVYRVLVHCTCA